MFNTLKLIKAHAFILTKCSRRHLNPRFFYNVTGSISLLTKNSVWCDNKQTKRRAKKRVLQTPERERGDRQGVNLAVSDPQHGKLNTNIAVLDQNRRHLD